jgi:hypothetical protein
VTFSSKCTESWWTDSSTGPSKIVYTEWFCLGQFCPGVSCQSIAIGRLSQSGHSQSATSSKCSAFRLIFGHFPKRDTWLHHTTGWSAKNFIGTRLSTRAKWVRSWKCHKRFLVLSWGAFKWSFSWTCTESRWNQKCWVKKRLLGLIIWFEVIDVGRVHVRKVVVEPKSEFDLALLSEHDLGRRHATEVHPSHLVELR